MSLIKKVDIPDNKRTYEKTLPFIDSILWNLWFQISENTKKDLTIALRMMWYFDHQYDKKQWIEKENFKNLYVDKFQNKDAIDVWEMNETTNQLIDILNDKWILDEFVYYIQKSIYYGDKASETEDCDPFIKYKYYEWYIASKLISLLLKCDENSDQFPYELEKLLCNTVWISNIFDDFLDLKYDYEHWISKLKPTLKNESKLLWSVISNSYSKILRSWQFNMKVFLDALKCVKTYMIKNIKLKK